jgi:hypothetical protein
VSDDVKVEFVDAFGLIEQFDGYSQESWWGVYKGVYESDGLGNGYGRGAQTVKIKERIGRKVPAY